MKVDLKLSPQQWRNAVIANAKEANPAYTDEEIIDKFGFDRVISLGADGMEDRDNMETSQKEVFKYTLLQIRFS